MQEPSLSHLRGSVRRDSYAYGIVLMLTLVSLGFQLAAPDEEWARVITVVVQSITLVAALLVSGVHRWIVRFAAAVAGIAVLGTVIAGLGSGEVGEVAGRTLGLLLVVLAPGAIVRGLVKHVRETGQITLRTMFGVLCVYLLVGMAFAFAYGLIAAAGDDPFFAEISGGTQSDFLYFSFTTLTTTGFGDLTPAYDLGRSLTITEALIGQIYLVTVVALIVGNIGASVRRPAR